MNKADKDYLNRVAELGCIICRRPAQIHHIRTGMGKSQRNDNRHVLPLCPDHHQHGGIGVAFHAGRTTWERCYGTEKELHEQVKEELGV